MHRCKRREAAHSQLNQIAYVEQILKSLNQIKMTNKAFTFLALAALCFLTTTDASAQQDIFTKRDNSQVRDGAGSYFKLLAVLPANLKLKLIEKSNRWAKVELPDKQKGWIAENCLEEKPTTKQMGKDLSKTWSSSKASRAGVAAAVKGFAKRFSKASDGSIEVIVEQRIADFSDGDYQAFKRELNSKRAKVNSNITLASLGLDSPYYDARLSEVEIGAGVAAKIATVFGLVEDPTLNRYVNMIAAALVENTNYYDWDFGVFILNDESINGFACPGGYIFITLGAIKNCSDESELAAIIGHEIAHIIRRHGLQEVTKRLTKIKAEGAFAELEEEIGDEKDEDEKELEDIAAQSYERIVRKRLIAYEFEADKIGSVLCAIAGYDPYGMVRISETVARVQATMPVPKEEFNSEYFAPDDAKERIKQIKSFVEKNYSATSSGRLKERYERTTR